MVLQGSVRVCKPPREFNASVCKGPGVKRKDLQVSGSVTQRSAIHRKLMQGSGMLYKGDWDIPQGSDLSQHHHAQSTQQINKKISI